MFLDHAVKILSPLLFRYLPHATAYTILVTLQVIGRLAFPIFAFLCAESCRKTRNLPKYMTRLFIFGILSDPAFDMAFGAKGQPGPAFFSMSQQNVMFTLALGCLAVYFYDKLKAKGATNFVRLLPAIVCAFAAELLHTDYGFLGVAMVLSAYIPETRRYQLKAMAAVLTALYFSFDIFAVTMWLMALAALILIFFYNGERGRPLKYFFYVFYPAHLFALVLIRIAAVGY